MHYTVSIPVELFNNPEIPPQAFRLIAYILYKAETLEQNFELRTKEWAQTLNCAPSTVRRWIKYLSERGYVVYESTKKRFKQFKVVLQKLSDSFSPEVPAEKKPQTADYEKLHESLSPETRQRLIRRVHERLAERVGTINHSLEHETLANELYKEELLRQ